MPSPSFLSGKNTMNNELSNAILELAPEGLKPRPDSQQERKSSETRETILDATLECLASHGYAETTNSRICDIAKISRGAMLHHYPTRQDLLVAVTDYAFYRHMTAFSQAVGKLDDEDRMARNSSIAIDWKLCQSREFQAYLELRVASRTNSELRTIFLPRARHHDLVWKEELLKVFPEWRDDMRKLELTRRLTRAILEGLTMSRDLWKDPAMEWTLLAFTAEMVRKIRVGELVFPSDESLDVFKKPALAATRRPRTKTTFRTYKKGGN